MTFEQHAERRDTAAYIAHMHPQRTLEWAAALETAIEALEAINMLTGSPTACKIARAALAKLKEKP